PWGLIAPLLAFLGFQTVGSIIYAQFVEGPIEFNEQLLLFDQMAKLVMFGVIVALMRSLGATAFDLGISPRLDRRDVLQGLIGCAAILPVVYAIQLPLTRLFENPAAHPLIQLLQSTERLEVLALIFV